MREAYAMAEQAEKLGEVPVGAVVAQGGKIIGRGCNRTLVDNDPTAHAEIIALREASKHVGNHRLVDAQLYVTIEPCTMCAGALVHARISKLHYATPEPRAGAVESTIRSLDNPGLNHRVEYSRGPCEDLCADLISGFFRRKRSQ
jgi:tRNA(adenine34) deaminase